MIRCMVIHPESDAEWIEEFKTQEAICDYCGENPELTVIELCDHYEKGTCHRIWERLNSLCDKGRIKSELCPRVRHKESNAYNLLDDLKKNGRIEL